MNRLVITWEQFGNSFKQLIAYMQLEEYKETASSSLYAVGGI